MTTAGSTGSGQTGANVNQAHAPATASLVPNSQTPVLGLSRQAVQGIVVFGLLGWIGVLTWLVVTSANPITVNTLQVLAANEVWIVERPSVAESRVTLVARLGAVDEQPVSPAVEKVVLDLPNANWSRAIQWIIPVRQEGTNYRLVSGQVTPFVDVPPLVYPASAESRRQVMKILSGVPLDAGGAPVTPTGEGDTPAGGSSSPPEVTQPAATPEPSPELPDPAP